MVSVPADTVVIEPLPGKTVAIVVLLLLHVPPDVPSVNNIEEPVHTVVGPDMPDGSGLTVIILETVQPAPSE